MPRLRVSGLGRSIRHDGGELAVLQDVDLVVEPGQAVGVTGPLDSGWRSLLRLIVGLDPATDGRVELEGIPGERAELRQEVVFASALDPLLDGDVRKTAAALARLAASRRRRVRPASWQAIVLGAEVGDAGGPWSRCERLRLCLALASALAPAHILLEVEPPLESAEDRAAVATLVGRILETGRGIVVATRDELLLAQVASHVLIFLDGAVLAEGSPEAVLTAAWRATRPGGPA